MDKQPDARPPRSSPTSERQGECEYVAARLRQLGATPAEVEAFVARWDAFDDEWTADHRAAFARLSDDRMRAHIVSARAEFPYEPPEAPQGVEQAPNEVVMGVSPITAVRAAPKPPIATRADLQRAMGQIADLEDQLGG